MKWLLFAIIMAGLIIWWRSAHVEQNNRSTAKPKPKTPTTPKSMSQCPFCGVRFPSDEGTGGYCSVAHKKLLIHEVGGVRRNGLSRLITMSVQLTCLLNWFWCTTSAYRLGSFLEITSLTFSK